MADVGFEGFTMEFAWTPYMVRWRPAAPAAVAAAADVAHTRPAVLLVSVVLLLLVMLHLSDTYIFVPVCTAVPVQGHHLEQGLNGIQFDGVADAWVRDVAIVNCDSGILVSGERTQRGGDCTDILWKSGDWRPVIHWLGTVRRVSVGGRLCVRGVSCMAGAGGGRPPCCARCRDSRKLWSCRMATAAWPPCQACSACIGNSQTYHAAAAPPPALGRRKTASA